MIGSSKRAWLWSITLGLVLVWHPGVTGAAQGPTDEQLAKIDFEQKLGTQVNPGLAFRDEDGKPVRIGDYFRGKPIILVLGYYECPMLCTVVMNGMIEALEDLKWTIGNQFDVVNISINPKETPQLAAAKKKTYLKRYGRAGAGEGWHFLTGKEQEIRAVAEEVGFRYIYDPKSGQYAHPSGLVFLTPEGKVARYQFGVIFKPEQLLANLQQARSGKPGSLAQKLVFLCFHYNPIQGRYGPTIMLILRIMAVVTLAAVAGLIIFVARRQKNRPRPAETEPMPKGGPGP